eukprot:7071877-Pyramimonas_sp.AAC.1
MRCARVGRKGYATRIKLGNNKVVGPDNLNYGVTNEKRPFSFLVYFFESSSTYVITTPILALQHLSLRDAKT